MRTSDAWATCRIGYTETKLSVALASPLEKPDDLDLDWPEFRVVEVDQALVESAVELALAERLKTLDALHLAAAITLGPNVTFATWDHALHAAAARPGLEVLPAKL